MLHGWMEVSCYRHIAKAHGCALGHSLESTLQRARMGQRGSSSAHVGAVTGPKCPKDGESIAMFGPVWYSNLLAGWLAS